MSKLKNLNFGRVFIDHGEKIGAGVIGLLAVVGLAGASWSACDKLPADLDSELRKARSAWESATWGDEQQQLFADTPNIAELAHRMEQPQGDISGLALSTEFNEQLRVRHDKLKSFEVLRPEDPEASLINVPVALHAEEELDETGEDALMTENADGTPDDLNNDIANLAPVNPGFGPGGPGGLGGDLGAGYDPNALDGPGSMLGAGGPGGMMTGPGRGMPASAGGRGGSPGPGGRGVPGNLGGPTGSPGPAGRGMPNGGSGGMMGMGGGGMLGMSGEYGDYEYGGYGDEYLSAGAQKQRIQLSKGISVRMVIPFRDQTNLVREAMNLSPELVQQLLIYNDLVIERKKRVEGIDPWSGDWMPLPASDLAEAEVIAESLAYDFDIVAPGVTRNTITMPLPRRVAGAWAPAEASHKRLTDFQLTDDEKRLVQLSYEQLAKKAEEKQARMPRRKAKGFSSLVNDAGDMYSSVYGRGEDAETDLYSDMSEAYTSGGADSDEDLSPEEIKKRMEKLKPSAVNRLLLVRFFDFTVDQGNTYIYRVRVAMDNPYFNRPVDDLEQPELALEEEVFSAWSDPTPAVYVPMGYRYFVQKTDGRVGADWPAEIAMYYEHPEAGMPVMSDVRVPLGTRIGGEKDTDVINLATNTLDSESVAFSSDDLLISVVEGPRLSAADAPELADYLKKIPRKEKAVADRITVIDHSGNLVTRSFGDATYSESGLTTEARDRDRMSRLIKAYEDAGWRRSETDAVASGFSFDPSGEMDSGYGGGGYGDLGAGNPLSNRNRNSARRKSGADRRNERQSGGGMGYGDGY